MTVPQLIRSMAAKPKGAVCLMGQHGHSMSYADLRRELDRNAKSLAGLGYGRQDKVAVLLPAGQSSVVTLLSTMSCSTCVPLNPEMPLEDVNEVLARVGASALILADQHRADAADLAVSHGVAVLRVRAAGENPFLTDLNSDPDAGPCKTPVKGNQRLVSTAGDDKALFLFTSGTSTAPKLVALTHRQLLASAASIAAALGLLADDRQLSLMPLHHIHGLSTVLASLVSGGSIVCTRGFVEGGFAACLNELGVTWYSASPSVHRQLIERQPREAAEALANSRLRFVRSASEKMQPGLMREMESRLGVPVIEAYGMTEASPQIASNRLNDRERKAGSVGRAAGPEIGIVDAHGTSLPRGTVGEIVIRGDNVITRYEDGDVDTHHSFMDGWLRTGDEGYLDDEGFLFITGRLDDVINRGGFKIAPARVEQILDDHPAIAESTVFGVPDNHLGQEVSAAVVLRQGSAAAAGDAAGRSAHEEIIKALHGDLARRLSRPELPKSYHVVEHLPVGPTGKRNRTVPTRALALIIPDPGWMHEADDREPPLSRTESRLVEIWMDVLRKDSFRTSDNFFDVGGDSLSAAQVAHKVNEVFQARLPSNCLFDHPSISSLSRAIGSHLSDSALDRQPRQSAATKDLEDEAAGSRDGYPLSNVQKQIWFMHHDDVGAAYHMSASLYLVGELDPEALGAAINEITRRHESLRIGIREDDGAATQFVRSAVDMRLEVVDLTDSPRSDRRNLVRTLESEAHNEPFELSGEPLCRWKLVRMDQEEHLLLVILHHIISDAWSVNILYRELSSIYSSILARHEHAAGKPPPSFAAYARSLSHGASAKHEPDRYWERKLEDTPEECRFPPDHPMPRNANYKGATITSRIDESLYRKVRSAARRCDVTPYVFLLAAFNALLFRYNAQSDSVVGTVVAGRDLPSTRDMMGCFANTVVLRSDVSGEASFESYVRGMAGEVRSTLEHADTSLMEIVRKAGVHRQHGRNPIFQTMFVFQDFPHSPAGSIDGDSLLTSSPWTVVEPDDLLIQHGFAIAEGLHAFPWRHDAASTKFDLTLYLRPGRADLFLAWQFRTCVYEKETVQRIADHFNSLLEMVVDDASGSIGSYRLPRHRVPGGDGNEGPANRATPIRAGSVIEQFRREVERNPGAIAVIAGDQRWTYTELDRISNQVARYLRRSGVQPGDVAAILLDRRIELVALLIGVWKSGATYLPCDPAYPPGRIAHMLRSSNARLVLSDQEAAFSRDLARGTGHVDLSAAWPAILQEPAHHLDDTGTEDTPAYMIYTSGSSGEPDKVVVTRGNLAYYSSAMKKALQLSVDDRYLQTASISFSSSIRQLVVPLVSGSSIILAGSRDIRDPEKLVHLVCSLDTTVVDLVPSHWSLIVRLLESMDPEHLARWRDAPPRLMLSASESFPSALYARLKVYAGGDTRIVNMYGQTETTGIVSMHWISDSDEARPAIPVGRPIPGTDIAILDERHQSVPIGAAGEVHVSSPAVTRHDLELDGKQYYKTGDLARYLHDGSMEFVGRLDQRIKIRGYRVNPVEVESHIRLCAGIQDVVVEAVAADDGGSAGAAAAGGNQLAAFVIGTGESTGRDASDAYRELRARIRQYLPDYMVPSRFVELPRFPSLPNGKIDRPSLRRMAAEQSRRGETRPGSGSRPDHLLTPTERTIAALWKQFLKIDAVEKDDNFFELGGDSILSIRVVERAREADIDISLEDLFQNQTLSSLAGCVDRKAKLDQQRSSSASSASDERPFAMRLSADSLREFSIEALTTAGLEKEIAEVLTGVQLEASLRGQPTHNVSSIPRYVRRIQAGKINAAPELRMIREGPTTAVISGDNGPGQWVAVEAMKLAMGKARENGIGLVSVRQSNHFGAAGHYPWLAAREGLIGLCTTNGPVILAPTGGLTATLGNNPLAVGVPAGSHPPILLDITMSVAPRGKIGVTLAEGQALPEGWIYDRHGRPSTNLADLAAGLGVPIGGHKGYGLALIMEVLAGVLSGAGFGLDHGREQIRQNSEAPDIGHFFLVVDPELFMPGPEFKSRVDALIAQIKSARRMDGVDDILIPGERELTTRDVSSKRGIGLRESEYQGLVRLGTQMKLKSKLEQV